MSASGIPRPSPRGLPVVRSLLHLSLIPATSSGPQHNPCLRIDAPIGGFNIHFILFAILTSFLTEGRAQISCSALAAPGALHSGG
ncbi:uncharacterized protein LAJ45_05001 [Morchella importuna]|uniref:uncharacterized protein n=1 Tax=Morchella importuna TaxID=1174673 RepID=UPI001E8D2F72|nr:uncharacterized protein LAJ45_05001 [Morchella importuna]KAH8150820.1 hypothetical protein LAJ45_05001 [Morchella importuna]